MSTALQSKPTTQKSSEPQRPSSLARFTIGFEYNKTLQEIRREVKARRI